MLLLPDPGQLRMGKPGVYTPLSKSRVGSWVRQAGKRTSVHVALHNFSAPECGELYQAVVNVN